MRFFRTSIESSWVHLLEVRANGLEMGWMEEQTPLLLLTPVVLVVVVFLKAVVPSLCLVG
jgi:hypothetical protein